MTRMDSQTDFQKESVEQKAVCRGIRGATTVLENDAEVILSATRELLQAIVQANELNTEDVASAIFTTTTDLDQAFPAKAARLLGWTQVPLLSGHEMDVPGALDRCIRILIHWNTTRRQSEINHVYLRGAKVLRPDLTGR